MSIALITGGSSGIGLEISKRFAENGYTIYWIALLEEEAQAAKKELLSELPKANIHYLIQDLSNDDGAQNTYDWMKRKQLKVSVLVNNAGFGTFGFANNIPLEKEITMIQLNVLSLFKLTRLFLDDMLDRDTGTIINISSNSSFLPVPKMAAYSASKAFIKQYSLSLEEELKMLNSKVRLITVCPAAIKDTQFKKVADMEKVKTFDGIAATTKKEVAQDVWNGYSNGKSYIVSGARMRRMMWISSFLPRPIIKRLIKKELSEKV